MRVQEVSGIELRVVHAKRLLAQQVSTVINMGKWEGGAVC